MELLALAACIIALKVVATYRARQCFATHLARSCCPWCGAKYTEPSIREAIRRQPVYAKAFAIRCAGCGRVQLLVPGVL
jgi:hypothetical protein